MGKWIKGLILVAFTLAILLGRLTETNPTALSVEDYWYSSGLKDQDLFDFVDNHFCHSSERYFLACANALQQVASRNNRSLDPDGDLEFIGDSSQREITEQVLLQPWKEHYGLVDRGQALEIDFVELWEKLKDQFSTQKKWPAMVGVALNGFLSVFRDPHTYLIPLEYYKQVIASPEHRISSYGFYLTKQKSRFVVKKVISDSPAYLLGLKKGDLILSLNGESIGGKSLFDVNEELKNPTQQSIKLEKQNRTGQISNIEIPRAQQALSTIHVVPISKPKSTALLTIDRFSRHACDRVRDELTRLETAGTQNLIIDLRDNPGGQMDETGCIAGLFTGPHRRIFSVRYTEGKFAAESYFSEEDKVFSGRVVVLVNRGTASAAEILAGSLRELGRAVLVGERTFGKGSFQEGDLWKKNKKLALFETKGFYYLPSGFSPQKVGLTPDIVVQSDVSELDRVSPMGSREEDQYWLPLEASRRTHMRRPLSGLKLDNCKGSGQSLGGHLDDPEMGQAQLAFGCWESAQLQGAAGRVSDSNF